MYSITGGKMPKWQLLIDGMSILMAPCKEIVWALTLKLDQK